MTDIRVVQRSEDFGLTLDWLLTPMGGLDTSDELASAVIVALGSDRRADPSDELPTDDPDRRGWWGDMDASAIWGGWPLGCRLWLLERAAIRGEASREGATLGRVEAYIREAVQPFVDMRIAGGVTVSVERVGESRIDALVRLIRGGADDVSLRFSDLWQGIEA
jgi:phage gp46-like protein